MGIALWIVASALATLVARVIRTGRAASWWSEPVIGLIAGIILGAIATVLDFGGWNEPEWRPAAFVFAGTLAVLAGARIIRLNRFAARSSAEAEPRPR